MLGNELPQLGLTEERVIAMKRRLDILKASIVHIIGHMNVSTYCP
jgi:hypothetical protein